MGHYVLFARLGHPVIEGSQIMGAGDLAMALWVLRNDYGVALKNLGTWRQQRFVRSVGKKFLNDSKLHIRVLNDFYRYWQWNNHTYEVFESTDGVRKDKGLSWIQTCKLILMRDWNYSHSDFMDAPYKMAVNDVMGAMVANDKVEIVSDIHKARREYVKQVLRNQKEAQNVG